MSWVITTLAGVVAGAAGSMGLGGGSVLLLYLTLIAGVSQLEAQGINLIVFLPTAAVALLLHSRSGLVEWREALICAAAGLLGAWGGFAIAGSIGTAALSKIFGGFMLLLGIRELFAPARRTQPKRANSP